MTEERAINVSTDEVWRRYQQEAEAELGRMRFALAQANVAIETVVAERNEMADQLKRQARLLPNETAPREDPGLPGVPEAPGANRQSASARR